MILWTAPTRGVSALNIVLLTAVILRTNRQATFL